MEGACGGILPVDGETEEEREARRKKNLAGPLQGTSIIPGDKKKWGKKGTIPKGKFIYEFFDIQTHHDTKSDEKDSYIQHYPGISKKTK